MYRRLLKEQQLFTSIDCYVTGSIDPGLIVIEGKPSEGVTLEQAENAIWEELNKIKSELAEADELEKVKNKVESTMVFSETNVLNKAMNLAFYELLGDVELTNQEIDYYEKVTVNDIQRAAKTFLTEENCCELYYKAKKGKVEVVC